MNTAWRRQQQRLFRSAHASALSKRTSQHLLLEGSKPNINSCRQCRFHSTRQHHPFSRNESLLNLVGNRCDLQKRFAKRIRPGSTVDYAAFSTLGPFHDDEPNNDQNDKISGFEDELVAISAEEFENPKPNSNLFWKRSVKKAEYVNSVLDDKNDDSADKTNNDDDNSSQNDDMTERDSFASTSSNQLSSNVGDILDKMNGIHLDENASSTSNQDEHLGSENPFATTSFSTHDEGLFSSLGSSFTDKTTTSSNQPFREQNAPQDSFCILQQESDDDHTNNPFLDSSTKNNNNDFSSNENQIFGNKFDNPFDSLLSSNDAGPFSFMDPSLAQNGDAFKEENSSSPGSNQKSPQPGRPQHLRDYDSNQLEDETASLKTEREVAFRDIRKGIVQQIKHVLETLEGFDQDQTLVKGTLEKKFQQSKHFLDLEEEEVSRFNSSRDRALADARALLRTLSDRDWQRYYDLQQSIARKASADDELITHFSQREEEHANIAAFLENRFGSENLESTASPGEESSEMPLGKEGASLAEPLTTEKMNLLLAHITLCMDPSEIQALVFRYFIDPNGGLDSEQFDATTFELIFRGFYHKLRNRAMIAHIVRIHAMKRKSHLWTPSSIALLFRFHRERIDVESAMDLFRFVESLKAFHMSGSSYQQLLALLIQQNESNSAKRVLQHMLENCDEIRKNYILKYVFRHWPFVKVNRVQEKSEDISFLREAFDAATSMSNSFAYTPSFHVLRQLIETTQPRSLSSKALVPALNKVRKDENEDRLTLIRDIFHFLQYEHEYYKPSSRMVTAALQVAEYFSDSSLAVNVLQRLFPSDAYNGDGSAIGFGDDGFGEFGTSSSFHSQSDQPVFDFGFDSEDNSGYGKKPADDRPVFDFGFDSEDSAHDKKLADDRPVFDFGFDSEDSSAHDKKPTDDRPLDLSSNPFEAPEGHSTEITNEQAGSESYRNQAKSSSELSTSDFGEPLTRFDSDAQHIQESSNDRLDVTGESSVFENPRLGVAESYGSSHPLPETVLNENLSFSNLSKVMDLCVQSGDVPSALTIFEKVAQFEDLFPFATQQMVFRCTLRTCASKGESEATERIFGSMLSEELNPR